VVQALIEKKANVDVQDNDGWSALMIASRTGHIEVVRSLIYAGAIPDLKNKEVSYIFLINTGHHP
jgi:ankyrin repeat protein